MPQESVSSPRWSSTTKLLVGLVIVGIAAFLLSRFSNLIPPLLMIFIITYLLHPVTIFFSRGLKTSWKTSVNLIYVLILLILIGLLTLGGVGLVGQIQSLVSSVQQIVTNLPAYIETYSGKVFEIGPFTLDMNTIDLNEISSQLISYVQPLLGQTGNLLSAAAGSAAQTIGWLFFILLVSYFVMVESSGLQSDLIKVNLPGYSEDFRRLGNELSRIWNAFLRGQMLIFSLATIVFTILFSLLGVKYAIGLAFMAGLAKFLPYIGPFITSSTIALVTFFQSDKPFIPFEQPILYTVIVLVVTSSIDNIIDNLITPRIMARTLKVHPAAVLVTALIFANLLGIIGVVVAAPLLATFTLLGRYITRKMLDVEPWPPTKEDYPTDVTSVWLTRVKNFFRPKTSTEQPEPIAESELPKEKSDERKSQRTKNRNARRNR
ncbi:MAG: AI-2E family transporter [Anaerolineales bacterium]|nr:MAG: AI-2E family transporter [Anaerolineales bacterium]